MKRTEERTIANTIRRYKIHSLGKAKIRTPSILTAVSSARSDSLFPIRGPDDF